MARRRRNQESDNGFGTVVFAAVVLGILWLAVHFGLHNEVGRILMSMLTPDQSTD